MPKDMPVSHPNTAFYGIELQDNMYANEMLPKHRIGSVSTR
jgi:hypothetical protein